MLERALHHVAFRTLRLQADLSEVEDRLFRRQLGGLRVTKPVFVTALPRAGTTLILELCVGSGEFGSHRYRDMPFILTPLLWSRFASRFRTDVPARERAHGDGMLVDGDSPEAFEEVVWKVFWSGQYVGDRILPWSEREDPEFSTFLFRHIRKIISLRSGVREEPVRYVSKNNLNIARIGLLRRMFPDAVILVPFRHPVQQAASLLRQHLNFLAIHARDPFARSYMKAIGHYDFGANLRPVDFEGWVDEVKPMEPTSLGYWVAYWTAAYGCLLTSAASGQLRFVSYDRLCEHPAESLQRVAEVLEVADRPAFLGQAGRIGKPRAAVASTDGIGQAMLDEARALHADLVGHSLS